MKGIKNLGKRGLSLFLTLVMCLSMAQITVFAADEHTHNADGWTCTQGEPTKTLTCDKHVHTDACYVTEQGELKCTAEVHEHGPGCYAEAETVLACELDEHEHGDGCYDEEGNLTCELAEHTHSPECYAEAEPELICGKDEHEHGDGCYEVVTTKTCTEEDHEHTDECYTVTPGKWTCTPPEKKEEKEENSSILDLLTPNTLSETGTLAETYADAHHGGTIYKDTARNFQLIWKGGETYWPFDPRTVRVIVKLSGQPLTEFTVDGVEKTGSQLSLAPMDPNTPTKCKIGTLDFSWPGDTGVKYGTADSVFNVNLSATTGKGDRTVTINLNALAGETQIGNYGTFFWNKSDADCDDYERPLTVYVNDEKKETFTVKTPKLLNNLNNGNEYWFTVNGEEYTDGVRVEPGTDNKVMLDQYANDEVKVYLTTRCHCGNDPCYCPGGCDCEAGCTCEKCTQLGDHQIDTGYGIITYKQAKNDSLNQNLKVEVYVNGQLVKTTDPFQARNAVVGAVKFQPRGGYYINGVARGIYYDATDADTWDPGSGRWSVSNVFEKDHVLKIYLYTFQNSVELDVTRLGGAALNHVKGYTISYEAWDPATRTTHEWTYPAGSLDITKSQVVPKKTNITIAAICDKGWEVSKWHTSNAAVADVKLTGSRSTGAGDNLNNRSAYGNEAKLFDGSTELTHIIVYVSGETRVYEIDGHIDNSGTVGIKGGSTKTSYNYQTVWASDIDSQGHHYSKDMTFKPASGYRIVSGTIDWRSSHNPSKVAIEIANDQEYKFLSQKDFKDDITITVKTEKITPPTVEEVVNLLKGKGNVEVQCNSNKHEAKPYDVVATDLTVGQDVKWNGSAYTCTVTVKAAPYVAKYNQAVTGANHTLTGEETKTLTLTWSSTGTKGWAATSDKVTFPVQCVTVTKTRWVNYNDTQLEEQEGDKQASDYTGTTPAKPDDSDGTKYDFTGWDNGTVNSKGVKTYKAQFRVHTDAPKLTGVKKERLTALPTGVTLPDGVTVNYAPTVAFVGNTPSPVTLLYKITVTGTAGAAYKVTDEGAEYVSGGDANGKEGADGKTLYVTGTIAEGADKAVIYVTKTFSASDVSSGKLFNIAYLAKSNDTTEGPEEGDGKNHDTDDGTDAEVKHTVTVNYVSDATQPVALKNAVTYALKSGENYDFTVEEATGTRSVTPKSPKTITLTGTDGATATYAYDPILTTDTLKGTMGDSDVTISVVYSLDMKGKLGTDGEGKTTDTTDGIPDKYQAKVTYVAGPDGTQNGVNTYATVMKDGKMATEGTISIAGAVATPDTGKRFVNWTATATHDGWTYGSWTDNKSTDATLAANSSVSAKGGEEYTFTAAFAGPVLQVSAPEVAATYDGKPHPVTPTATKEGATFQVVYKDAQGNEITGVPTDAGTYTAVITAMLGDETATSDPIQVTIEKAVLTVSTNSASKTYDGTPLTAGGSVTGLVNGETVTLTMTGSQTAVGSSSNTYTLTWDGTAEASNYTVTEALGTLTVSERRGGGGGGGGGTGGNNNNNNNNDNNNEPVVDIDEPDVPLVDVPDVDVPQTETPEELVEVPEEDVPLADVPKTGDNTGLWRMAALMSAAGLAVLTALERRQRREE